MEWQELIADGFSRVLEVLEPAFDGLTPADLDLRPNEQANSMGWTAWHLCRGADAQIAALMGANQVWTEKAWFTKFKMPPDPDNTGYGASSEEVGKFRSPEPAVILGYYREIMAHTKKYLSSLGLSDLDRKLDETWFQPVPTVGIRLVSILADSLEHAGEIAYIRGLVKGNGWQG